MNYSSGTLPCPHPAPHPPINFTSSPSPLSRQAFLCKSPVSFITLPNLAATAQPGDASILSVKKKVPPPPIPFNKYMQMYERRTKCSEANPCGTEKNVSSIVQESLSIVSVSVGNANNLTGLCLAETTTLNHLEMLLYYCFLECNNNF